MQFFDVFWPTLTAMWLVVGMMCIKPGIAEAISAPWGSEEEGGGLTKLGYIVVAIYYVITGPIHVTDFVNERP